MGRFRIITIGRDGTLGPTKTCNCDNPGCAVKFIDHLIESMRKYMGISRAEAERKVLSLLFIEDTTTGRLIGQAEAVDRETGRAFTLTWPFAEGKTPESAALFDTKNGLTTESEVDPYDIIQKPQHKPYNRIFPSLN